MAIKKKKIRKALFYIILRHLKTKVWNLNEGKFGLKSTFKKENKGVFHQTVKNILVSEREAHVRFCRFAVFCRFILLCKKVL